MFWLIPIVLISVYTLYKAIRHFKNDRGDSEDM
jgi:hypothetical protein